MPHSEDEAKAILDPYMDPLGRIFPVAWSKWEEFGEKMPEVRLTVSRRSRASLLNDFGATAAEEIFRDTNVVLTDQPGFLLMIFDSKLHVRLKKYRGRTCQTSSIPTDQSELYNAQQPLIGFPEASNCVHGYVLKADASGFAETAIKCSTDKKLHWKINVPQVSEGKAVEQLPARGADVVEPGISSTLTDDERTEEGGIGG